MLWLLGWVPVAAAGVLAVMLVIGAARAPKVAEGLAMIFVGLAAGALLHAAAYALEALQQIERLMREQTRRDR